MGLSWIFNAGFNVLKVADVTSKGYVLAGKLYFVVERTITCLFISPRKVKKGQDKCGPEHSKKGAG